MQNEKPKKIRIRYICTEEAFVIHKMTHDSHFIFITNTSNTTVASVTTGKIKMMASLVQPGHFLASSNCNVPKGDCLVLTGIKMSLNSIDFSMQL